MWESLCSLCGPSGFGGRGESEMSKAHTFPQGVLAAVTLIWGAAGDWGDGATARCDPGFSYSPWPSLPSGGQGQIPRCWSCGPEGWRLADSTSCKCAFLPLTAVTPLPQKGTVLEWEGPQVGAWCRLGCSLGWSYQSELQTTAHPSPLQAAIMATLALFRSAPGLSWFRSPQLLTLWGKLPQS